MLRNDGTWRNVSCSPSAPLGQRLSWRSWHVCLEEGLRGSRVWQASCAEPCSQSKRPPRNLAAWTPGCFLRTHLPGLQESRAGVLLHRAWPLCEFRGTPERERHCLDHTALPLCACSGPLTRGSPSPQGLSALETSVSPAGTWAPRCPLPGLLGRRGEVAYVEGQQEPGREEDLRVAKLSASLQRLGSTPRL